MVTFLKRSGFAAGYTLMLFGAALLLVGLAVDLTLHARDVTLWQEEGIFGLSNPGHVVILAGLFFIIAGAFLGPYSRWVLPSGSLAMSLAAPVAALTLAFTLSTAFALQIDSMAGGHDDEAAASARPEATQAATPEAGHGGHPAAILPQNQALVEIEELTFHEPANTQAITEDNLRFAEDFLKKARAETEKYRDVKGARADGYMQITQDLPLIGAHFFNAGRVGSLEPGQPGILLYEQGDEGGWELVGLNFMLPKQPGVDTPPDTPFGGLAHWHYHTDLCFGPGSVSIAASAAECAGLYVPETPWLLHVWVWKDSPEGVFDHANSLLQ